jgi:hypothetical protein
MNQWTGVAYTIRHTQRATTRRPPPARLGRMFRTLVPTPPAQDFVFHVSFVLVRTQMKYVNARPDPNWSVTPIGP